MHTTFPAHLILLDLISPLIFSEDKFLKHVIRKNALLDNKF
jgi:hypothetical protein